jgi:hypothetical protein
VIGQALTSGTWARPWGCLMDLTSASNPSGLTAANPAHAAGHVSPRRHARVARLSHVHRRRAGRGW